MSICNTIRLHLSTALWCCCCLFGQRLLGLGLFSFEGQPLVLWYLPGGIRAVPVSLKPGMTLRCLWPFANFANVGPPQSTRWWCRQTSLLQLPPLSCSRHFRLILDHHFTTQRTEVSTGKWRHRRRGGRHSYSRCRC